MPIRADSPSPRAGLVDANTAANTAYRGGPRDRPASRVPPAAGSAPCRRRSEPGRPWFSTRQSTGQHLPVQWPRAECTSTEALSTDRARLQDIVGGYVYCRSDRPRPDPRRHPPASRRQPHTPGVPVSTKQHDQTKAAIQDDLETEILHLMFSARTTHAEDLVQLISNPAADETDVCAALERLSLR